MIERKIIIGLITNTEYLKQLQADWNPAYIESATAKLLADWCWTYFKKYDKAPMRDIETIFLRKLKRGLDKDLAEEIEEEILPKLSAEYEKGEEDITFLLEETQAHFTERQIIIHNETIAALLQKNKIEEAEKEVDNFQLTKYSPEEGLDLSDPKVLDKIDIAFDTSYQSLIKFPGALGEFWNDQLVRGSLIALLAPEKRGKTFWLLEFMMRAYKQGRKVAFFQAGDMTENQQLIRICIYLAQKSNKEQFCGKQYIPVLDCIKNQADTCNKKIRECDYGVIGTDETKIRETITMENLIALYEENPRYKNCYNCVEFRQKKWGTIWLKEKSSTNPLTANESKKLVKKFFIDTKRQIKLSTHENGSLTIPKIKAVLNIWKIRDKFEPEIVLIDYGDLIEGEEKEERHKQNKIWKSMRGLNQKMDNLWIVPTQSDALSYEKNSLSLKNYSEDKRKYAHATAFYGLNQDVSGREKKLGLMRIGKILIREGEFYTGDEVTVFHRLQIGRPFLGSYF
jgi:hypothetical protein